MNITGSEKKGLKKLKKRDSELEKLISQVDLFAYIEQNYGSLKQVGRRKNEWQLEGSCPKCGHYDHFAVFPDTNSYSSYSDCCNGGTIIDFLIEIEGLDIEAAIQKIKEFSGESSMKREQTKEKKAPSGEEGEEKENDFTNLMDFYYKATSAKDKQHFLNRGIPLELIDKYKLSIVTLGEREAMILPVWEKGKAINFVTRFLDDKKPKYKNHMGTASFFNLELLTKANDPNEKKFVFLTEGIFDALSLESMGFNAISLNGVNNADNLKDALEKIDKKGIIFLTAFDNDEAGIKCKEKFDYKAINIPDSFKDINQWHMDSLQKLQEGHISVLEIKEGLHIQLAKLNKPDAVSDFLDSEEFESNVNEFIEYKKRKTGFLNLDLELKGLFPGLYVIGGISSVGKTTFTHQLTDQLAEQGHHIIFFSLEQSKFEMISKSIARTTAKIDLNDAVPSVFIRSGDKSNIVKKAIKEYRGTAENVSIIEGNFNTDVNTVRQYVKSYAKDNDCKPIVVIDYLQIMPSIDARMSDKQRIDTNVTELKRLSRDLNLTIFVISSLNRGNYLAPIDFESFKESGGIEYTADVVWGLQLEVINDPVFHKEKNMIEKREKIKKAKLAEPREIELICLKNRNGNPSFSCSFSYWAKYDFFEPNLYSSGDIDEKEKKAPKRL